MQKELEQVRKYFPEAEIAFRGITFRFPISTMIRKMKTSDESYSITMVGKDFNKILNVLKSIKECNDETIKNKN